MKEMSEYEILEARRNKEKVEKLERFERTVRGATATIDIAIRWLWAIVILLTPAFLYFKPLPPEAAIQASFALILSLFLLIVSIVWKAIGKAMSGIE